MLRHWAFQSFRDRLGVKKLSLTNPHDRAAIRMARMPGFVHMYVSYVARQALNVATAMSCWRIRSDI